MIWMPKKIEMKSADWARTPGARKSMYGRPSSPVGIAFRRVNVWPKMTSHSAGWIARV